MAPARQTGIPTRSALAVAPPLVNWCPAGATAFCNVRRAGIAFLASLLLAGCGTVEPVRRPTPLPRQASPLPAARPPRTPPSAATWRSAVQAWYGTPYRYGGTDRRGIDCSGFTWQLYRSVAGVTLPRTAAAQFSMGISVARTALRPGDLVFFSEPGRGIIHVGISLGGDQFGHASVQRGVTITSLREPWYAARWCGAKRVLH